MQKRSPALLKVLDDKRQYVVFLYFIVYLVAGLILFDDYGVSWDETTQRVWGNEYYDLITRKDPLVEFWQAKYYGPFFQIILAIQEHLFNWQDSREIFLSYHAMTFLYFFIGVIFFYLIAKKISGKWKLSLLACSLLILSPRIFADSFYNPKDIPILVIFIISAYTLLRLYEKTTTVTVLIHAITSAAAITTRIIGLMIPVFTIAILLLAVILKKNGKPFNTLLLGMVYLAATSGLTILFWPILYFEPGIFVESFRYMRNFPFEDAILYRGGYYHCTELYRDYLPRWIVMTTPIFTTILFLVGVIHVLHRIAGNILKPGWLNKNIGYFLPLYWFFVPLAYVYIMRPCIYTGWRHFYFIYPAMILIAMLGIDFIYSSLHEWRELHQGVKNAIRLGFSAGLLVSLISVVLFMWNNHPFEFLYFNRLAGKDMIEVKQNYDMDYYRVSYRQALEYILKNDPSPLIKIINTSNGLKYNYSILSKEDRTRIYFWIPNDTPGYLITEKDEPPEGYSTAVLFHSIMIGDAPILSIYIVTQ